MGYYAGMLAYYWVLATPAVGFLFGCYLYVAVNLFHCHYDEAFSALRIPHYKGFSRLHLTAKGDLVVYALAMDQVISLPSAILQCITERHVVIFCVGILELTSILQHASTVSTKTE